MLARQWLNPLGLAFLGFLLSSAGLAFMVVPRLTPEARTIGRSPTPIVDERSRATARTASTEPSSSSLQSGDMVRIPRGPFLMGGESIYAPEPPVTVVLSNFYIDRTEVTNADFANFVARTAYQTTAERAGDVQTWRSVSGPGRERNPVIFVTWDDAVAYCENVGERLPIEAEWEKAARGTDGRLWPWGNQWDPTRANTMEGGIGYTVPVGSYPNGVSPYGLYDMSGNVWEWTASSFSSNLSLNPMAGVGVQGQKVLRGGSWRTIANGTQSSYRKSAPDDY